MFAKQTEIHFIAAVYNNYIHAHCLHWLMLIVLLFQIVFASHINKFTTCEMVPVESSKLHSSENQILLPLSICVYLGLVLEYWPIVGTCGCHNHSKLDHSCHSVFPSLLPPSTSPQPSLPLLCWQKIQKVIQNISHDLICQLIV